MEPNIPQPISVGIPPREVPRGHSPRIFLVLLGLILIALVLVFCIKKQNGPGAIDAVGDNGAVQAIDLSSVSNAGRLPEGFPADIPVETSGLVESTRILYENKDATLYSVTYNTGRQMEELYAVYSNFLTTSKFIRKSVSKAADKISFEGVKASTMKDDISILITSGAHSNTVHISYISRE